MTSPRQILRYFLSARDFRNVDDFSETDPLLFLFIVKHVQISLVREREKTGISFADQTCACKGWRCLDPQRTFGDRPRQVSWLCPFEIRSSTLKLFVMNIQSSFQ